MDIDENDMRSILAMASIVREALEEDEDRFKLCPWCWPADHENRTRPDATFHFVEECALMELVDLLGDLNPPPPVHDVDGVGLIARERRRQIDVEGWTPEHDANHPGFELTKAAESYAWLTRTPAPRPSTVPAPFMWPWAASWWKPSDDPIRNLVRAGALLAAEIDRLTAERGARAR